MPSSKEIRTKITSIKKTQKITDAMQKVAASKMRRAQQRMESSNPYADKIREVMSHIASSHTEYRHPYLQPRPEIKRVGYLVVSTDRGLCGGLNTNLFKMVLEHACTWQNKNVKVDWCLFGNKAQQFFKQLKANVIAQTADFNDTPQIADLIGSVKVMLDEYDAGHLDRIFIAHNEFVSTMVQKPRVWQLLPLQASDTENQNPHYWDYLYEPDPKELLNALLIRYIETQVYQAVVDNLACEQVARMLAMKSATDNAEELVTDLQLMYNKARQAAITQEIAEIIGGAAAL